MKSSISNAALLAIALLLSTVHASAADSKASAPQATSSKAGAKVKLVDINSATKDELKTLPGIKDAEADKIIKERPYRSKVLLVSLRVISDDVYKGLKDLIFAKYKDGPRLTGYECARMERLVMPIAEMMGMQQSGYLDDLEAAQARSDMPEAFGATVTFLVGYKREVYLRDQYDLKMLFAKECQAGRVHRAMGK